MINVISFDEEFCYEKSLVLAMTMALGVTASAYAANPFSDVPAGHWAYDSVAELAAAGVVDGYTDGTFGGDKLMTCYEMAQIVAKGANVDKLAAEFADELDTLGVRVANLEKKADNVKIIGQIRYEYAHRDGDAGQYESVALHRLRTRLFVNGPINDNWSYIGRIENNQNMHNDAGDEKTSINQAYVQGKLGGFKVMACKAPLFLADGNLYDDSAEFAGLTYGKDVQLNAYYGQPTGYGYDSFYGAALSGKIGAVALSVGYDQFKDAAPEELTFGANELKTGIQSTAVTKGEDLGVYNVGAKVNVAKNLTLDAMYLKSDADDNAWVKDVDDDGFVVGLSYKGAKASEVGSWGLWGKYYDQGVGTFVAHTMKAGEWKYTMEEGFKGYGIGATYTLAKNIVYMLDYYNLEGKKDDTKDSKILWSRLQVTF